MILGIVKGEIHSTINHSAYDSRRLLLVDRITPDGREDGNYLIAVAAVDAGVGQTVLMIDEGNSARQIVDDASAPIRSIIIGVVDEIDVGSSDEPRT
ncbi:MAG: EutN/CcmL family microcompartment protein [Planctomycetes bacterium]|nr:EutN/CcmL family microcompartment protein [Planctomycetota bacterium]